MFASKNSITKEINLLGKKIRKVELLYNKTKKNLRKDQDNYQNICLDIESSKKNLNEVINKNVLIYKKEKISKLLEKKKKVIPTTIVNPKRVSMKNTTTPVNTSKKGILKKTTVNEVSSNTKQVSPKKTVTKKISSNTKHISPKKPVTKKISSNKSTTNSIIPKKTTVKKLSQPKSTKNNGSADKTGVLKPKIVKALSKWADKAKKNKNSGKKTDKTGNNKDKKEGEIPFIITDKGRLRMKPKK